MQKSSLSKLDAGKRQRLLELAKTANFARILNVKQNSIVPIERGGPLALSFAQQRLWFLNQLERQSAFYNIPVAVRLTGTLDVQALRRTLQEIVNRHEALRTRFEAVDGTPVQVIDAQAVVELPLEDLRGMLESEREGEAQRLAQEEAQAPFDLSRGPLLRARLLRLGEDEHVVLLTMHHIVSDGWSMGVLVREVAALYTAFVRGEASPLAALPVQYADYAHWQRQWLQGEVLAAQLDYWKGQLADAPVLLALPTDRPRPAVQSYAGSALEFTVDAATTAGLNALARDAQATLFMVLAAAFNVLLARHAGQDDICLGTPIANRTRTELEGLIGFFVNTLVLRTRLSGNPRFTALLEQVRETALGAYAHQDVPFEQLVEVLQPQRGLSHSPLFQVMLVLQNAPMGSLALPGLSLETLQDEAERSTSKFDLTLTLTESQEQLQAVFEYSTDLFERQTVERMSGHFMRLLESVVEQPSMRVDRLAMLPEAERRQLVEEWNDTVVAYPHDRTIHSMFEAQAGAHPDAVALEYEDRTLTYGELNRRANQVAHRLLSLGIRPDDRVAICVERGFEMIVGLLGILKSGAGYVPLDPAYPTERLAYTLGDSTPVALLTHSGLRDRLPEVNVPVLPLDQDEVSGVASQPEHNPDVSGLTSSHLAYVIYTSGSTGLPKGVMVEHRNVARLFSATQPWFHFNQQDVWALFHSFAFDFSVWEIWGALVHGGRLLVVPQWVSRSPQDCYALLCDAGVTILNQTPSAFRQLLAAQGESDRTHMLRQVIFGGEALETGMLKPWYARAVNAKTQMVNMYGITETTVHVTYRALEAADAELVGVSPIGGRIPDLQLYLLDAQREPVPVGVVGEMYVGGAGVTRGYLNRPELTTERFIADTFSGHADARLYKTGDLGRWLPDGSIEYLGRNDDQVKIRGFRIELGEIEAKLAACAGVREAVVIAREDEPGEKRLVGYVIAQEGADLSAFDLRTQLLSLLAEYMVPSAFVTMASFPLTANGKLDRRALPAPQADAYASREYEAPRGEIEEALGRLWADVLGVERVGRHDHFFELGGHSLLAMKLIERMRQAGLSADVRVLFGQPTLAALAAAVGGGTEVVVPANGIPDGCERITRAMLPLAALSQDAIDRIVATVPGGARNVQDIYALAPLQEGILYHHLTAREGDPYVLQALFGFESRARLEDFAQALQQVIDRHDILRTAVIWEGLDEPVQVVWREVQLRLEDVALDLQAGDIATQLHSRFDARHYRLDVRQAPLMRLVCAQDSVNDRWVAVLLFHHMALDHAALEVVQHEMQAFLLGQGGALPEAVPYRNYVAQVRLGVSREAHEAFFREMLGDLEEPTLPFGLQDVQGDGTGIEEARLAVDAGLSRRLRVQARQLGVSAASVVHLAWARVVGRVSGKEEVVFGTVLLGRMQGGDGADRALGMFINTLPLRVDVGAQGVRAGVKATHARLSALLGHEHASLALAQRCSGVAAPAPLFSALLNYRHSVAQAVSREAVAAWQGMEALGDEERTNYPLTLSVDDLGEDFSMAVQAVAGIGAQRVGSYMLAALERLANALEQAPQAPLHSLDILPEAERKQVLVEFNATERTYPQDKTIHALFEAQVERTPEAVAVVQGGQSLSYGELNARANRLAHYLRKQGVQPDARVAICVERSAEMVVGLLAILKAGGGYVPLDPSYPQDRLAYMLADSAPAAVLAQASTRGLLAEASVPVIDLDSGAWQDESVSNPQVPGLLSSHLAYVIYTSGSTGLPKGVMIEHRNTVNFLAWAHRSFDHITLSKTLFSTSLNFDLAVYECFAPLTSGGSINVVKDVLELQQGGHDITLINTVPSALNALLESGGLSEEVDTVNVAGEALKRSLVERLFEQTGVKRLCNLYGPSETTTYSSWVSMDRETGFLAHIGKPIANTQFYLLDDHRQPVPLGVPGEIYIGGAGVARGYLNRAALTAERFLDDPFSEQEHARMYRTGDLGRYLPDGNIEYLGRNDDQVKIRGFRIELGEIEAKLAKHEGVKEAVVMAREDVGDEKRLVAYYTPQDENAAPEAEDLRAHLQAQLPEYMVPAAYVRLDTLPLTPNGKLDRKALPAPGADAYATRGYEAPQGELETAIAGIWQQLLGLAQVGRHEDFFDLGGHSLLAVRLISQVRQRLGVELAVGELFAHRSVASMASMVQGRTPDTHRHDAIVPVRTGGTQRPLFLVHEFTGLDFYFPVLAAHIDPDIPVYGLPGIPWGKAQLQTMEGLATRLLGVMRSVQPEGPYRLAGWSFGGLLAYEIAMQLVGQDEEVEFVGLIDTDLPKRAENGKARWTPGSAHKLLLLDKCDLFWNTQVPAGADLEPILRTLSNLQADIGSFDFDGLVRRCREKGVLHPELAPHSTGELWQYVDREVAHGHALANYTVFPVSTPVHVFVASERREDAPLHTGSLGWDDVLNRTQLHCVTVPGDHLTMMEAPHVEALGRAVGEALRAVTARPAPAPSKTSYQPLVTIQGGGASHAPVFCIPGAGDSVTGFVGLADALGPAWPMHGLQPRGLDGSLVPYSSVEAAAEAYLKAIDAVEPDDPVHLIGHSFGGWIVFEMASRLRARGRIVASLTLIDSEAPGGDGMLGKPYTATGVLERLIETMQLAAGESFGIDAAAFRAQDDVGQMRLLHTGMVRAGMLHQRSTPDAMRGPARVFGTALRTLYLPRHSYTGPVRLVLADDPALDVGANQRAQRERIEGWRRHAPNLGVWHGPGNHFTILKAPHVRDLAVWWRTAFQCGCEEEVTNESV